LTLRFDSSTGTLHPSGEIDVSTAPRLLQGLEEARATGRQIVVDFGEVTFIDSMGLHALIRTAVSLDGAAPLVLERVSPFIVRLLKIVGMDELSSLEIRSAELRRG
jgi:anti-anti-sigma factor